MEKREKIAELGQGLSIWLVHLDTIREQDRNARIMSMEKFTRLTENIKKDQRLESLPLTYNPDPANVETYFELVSGHHRMRAARKAGLQEVYVLNEERERSRSEIVAKQLAHNALNGRDDEHMLAELYKAIEDVEAKIASGVTDADLKLTESTVAVDDVFFDLSYEQLNILFLPRDFQRFEQVLAKLEDGARVYLADKADFERFKAEAHAVNRRFRVVNTSAVMAKMLDLLEAHLSLPVEAGLDPAGDEELVSLTDVLGSDQMPRRLALAVRDMVRAHLSMVAAEQG
jgi:hypothetical protein